MLSSGCGHKKVKTQSNPTLAGRTFKLEGSDLHTYIPLWCLGMVDRLRLIPETHTPQNTHYHKPIIDAFFVYHSTSIIPIERNCNHLSIAAEQLKDDAYSKIIRACPSSYSSGTHIEPKDHQVRLLRKHRHQFFLEPVTSILLI